MFILFFHLFMITMQGYETQPYQVIDTIEAIEIRYYPSVKLVQTESLSEENQNFSRLFRYISGANNTNQKIAMTTPVHMKSENKSQKMAFVLPASFNENPPKPVSDQVKIISSKAGYFAAIRYGGYSNVEKVKYFTDKLQKTLNTINIESLGIPTLLGYNAPYKFYNRRNEIIIEITYTQSK
tara:strand:- start:675 stop:1220 length:546 start_codon:yes stop_codon:yes gene_type:complete